MAAGSKNPADLAQLVDRLLELADTASTSGDLSKVDARIVAHARTELATYVTPMTQLIESLGNPDARTFAQDCACRLLEAAVLLAPRAVLTETGRQRAAKERADVRGWTMRHKKALIRESDPAELGLNEAIDAHADWAFSTSSKEARAILVQVNADLDRKGLPRVSFQKIMRRLDAVRSGQSGLVPIGRRRV